MKKSIAIILLVVLGIGWLLQVNAQEAYQNALLFDDLYNSLLTLDSANDFTRRLDFDKPLVNNDELYYNPPLVIFKYKDKVSAVQIFAPDFKGLKVYSHIWYELAGLINYCFVYDTPTTWSMEAQRKISYIIETGQQDMHYFNPIKITDNYILYYDDAIGCYMYRYLEALN